MSRIISGYFSARESNFVVVLISIIIIVNVKSCQGITFEQDTTLSLQQKKLLDEYKELVLPLLENQKKFMKTDLYLLKWLRTSHWDVSKAKDRLLNHIKWRRDNKMDTIHLEDFSDVQNDFKYYLDGRDKFGKPYMYIDTSELDLRRAILQGKGQKLMRYADKAIQESCDVVREQGEKFGNITRGHTLINAGGFNIVQHACLRCVPFLLRIVTSYQDHYPECDDLFIVVNTPGAIEPLLNAIIPLLSIEIKQSLRIFGKNKNSWLKGLAEEFGRKELPLELGGETILEK